jgi:hypothetical protein
MLGGRVIVFNATFNFISVISWRLVLFEEETGVPGENHQPATSHQLTLSHYIVSNSLRYERLLAHDRWFTPGTPASSTTKTGRHEIAEILLKVALNTKNQIKSNQIITMSGIRIHNVSGDNH